MDYLSCVDQNCYCCCCEVEWLSCRCHEYNSDMIIAVLKETKIKEGRVAMVPQNAHELVKAGHIVLVQKKAGVISGFPDALYVKAGAKIVVSTRELLKRADLVIKVKELTFEEVELMRPGQIFFGYLHLAALSKLLKRILVKKITAIGYETVQLTDGTLPLLKPMSEIAGKLATQNGSYLLRADQGGRGVLIGGTETVSPAKVLILGGGVVGANAARISIGMGGDTTILDVSSQKLQSLQREFGSSIKIGMSDAKNIAELVPQADLLIGSVLICGAEAPKLVSEALVKKMKPGSVIMDVAVDQGGCVSTSKVTTHEKPTFIKHGVLHYGVANMPGSVPVTATMALTNASFSYVKALADLGLERCLHEYPEMRAAVNCDRGEIVHSGLKHLGKA
jgi:alanine dehydrogenase